ncbi:MAG: CoA-binding protein [Deltaproteobacteria bacterium]|nr:CoA-binding protein [Deltaproteobacteria bacterium]
MKNEKINDIETFFNPQGIVIIGARSSPGFGYGIPMNLKEKGWEDRLFLVNPKGGQIDGMHVYEKVADVPGPASLAIIIIPAQGIPELLPQLREKGIRHVIIESAGFAETGDSGKALQDETYNILKKHGMRAIGPNCVGIVNTDNKLSTTETIQEAYIPGNTAIIAQSGVFGNILLDKLHLFGLYISKAVTLGNRIDVSEIEMLDYFHKDPLTNVIMMYLEGASNGRLLAKTLYTVTRDKPVLILKSGRTSQGQTATASHTGSLSGEDFLYDGMFSQTGAIRAESLDCLVEFARVFSSQPLPKGPRLGIVTGSGSLGALATDAAVLSGLEVPSHPSTATINKIKKLAPNWMNVKNPLDVGPSGRFKEALGAMMKDTDTDMVLAILTIPHAVFRNFQALGIDLRDWFGELKTIRKLAPEKPALACVVGHQEFLYYATEIAGPDMPVFTSPEMSVKALAALWQYGNWKTKVKK